MSPHTYSSSVFLDERAQYLERDIRMRLEDVFLAFESAIIPNRRVHFILNTAFCGSTLLARHLELIPNCFVLKEPRLLAQLAELSLGQCISEPCWNRCFALAMKMLSRTYRPSQIVIIKPLESCNQIAQRFLKYSSAVTVTFLLGSLRHFLLSVLKSADRCNWVLKRVRQEAYNVTRHPALTGLNPSTLTAAQAAACLWLLNRRIRNELLTGEHRARIRALDPESLVRSPKEVLSTIARTCRGWQVMGVHFRQAQGKSCTNFPSPR